MPMDDRLTAFSRKPGTSGLPPRGSASRCVTEMVESSWRGIGGTAGSVAGRPVRTRRDGAWTPAVLRICWTTYDVGAILPEVIGTVDGNAMAKSWKQIKAKSRHKLTSEQGVEDRAWVERELLEMSLRELREMAGRNQVDVAAAVE